MIYRFDTASMASLLLMACISVQADLFVSPTGLDASPGSEARPFMTLERARDAIRGLKHDGKIPKDGMTVWLRGGDYYRTNALELSDADSGTPQGPIVWRAFRDERVRLRGGRKLEGFRTVTDSAVIERLDESARGPFCRSTCVPWANERPLLGKRAGSASSRVHRSTLKVGCMERFGWGRDGPP